MSEHIAKTMFGIYNEEGPNPWKTFDGRDVPKWEELSDQVKGKWMAVARHYTDDYEDGLEAIENKLKQVCEEIEEQIRSLW